MKNTTTEDGDMDGEDGEIIGDDYTIDFGEEFSVADANNKFNMELYYEVHRKFPGQNFVVSSFSVSSVLAMYYVGSAMRVRKELKSVLHFPATSWLKKGFRDVTAKMQENNDTEFSLQTASNIFVRNTFEMDEAVSEDIKSIFLNEVQTVDFRQGLLAARTINFWVEDKTKKKIRDIVSPDMFSADTIAVLVNAIYFQGKWLTAFEKKNTNTQTFYVSKTKSVEADMMQQTNKFHVSSLPQIKAKVILLPYEGGRMSMYIFLPDEQFGLPSVERYMQVLGMDKLKKMLQMKVMMTKLKMPKFKIDSHINLKEILIKMGVEKMFNLHASKLFPNNQLVVDDVFHQAIIEVDEEGTVAAAATAAIASTRAGGRLPTPFSFIADHPFLYMLIDSDTGFVLFTGRLIDPTALSGF